MNLKSLLLPFFLLVAGACGRERGPQDVAEEFLAGYLDCRFSDVADLASPEMLETMRWRASQLTQAEVDLLRGQAEGAQVTTDEMEASGDTCWVTVSATDALIMDSIAQPGRLGDGRFRLTLAREKKRDWKVVALTTIP
ncbi:MAG: hypothetical protein IJV08_10065 [Bacteroidaceae bacterium]|nr:hypothetical protein [Bacteroidaceae bacterium]